MAAPPTEHFLQMRITFELEIDEILAWADPEHFALNVSAPGCCTRQTAPEQIRDDLYSVGGRCTPTSVLAASLGVIRSLDLGLQIIIKNSN